MLKGRMIALLTLLGLLALSLGLSACGSSGAMPGGGGDPAVSGGVLAEPLASAQLPSPADALREVSANAVQRLRGGGEYLPNLRGNAGKNDQFECSFEPEWNGVTEFSPAWAVYNFYLPDYDAGDMAKIWFSDNQLPPSGGMVWAGFSDFDANVWRWYEVDTADPQSAIIDLPNVPINQYINGDDGQLLVCFLTLEAALLQAIQIGEQAGPVPAVPMILDSLTESDTVVSLNGTHSFSENFGNIELYEWDIDGDGVFEVSGNQLEAGIVDPVAPVVGMHKVTLRVTDEAGFTDTNSAWVMCWDTFNPPDYNEVEDNDTYETAQQLPGVPFTGFRGNCGTGGANDGDDADWYEFKVYFDTKVWVYLWLDNPVNLYMELYDQYGNQVAESTGAGIFSSIETQAKAGRYFLKVDGSRTLNQNTDYSLDINASFPNEAPVAFLTAVPNTLVQGQDVTLYATQCFDPDGGIVETWFDLYGDGTYERQGTDTSTTYTVMRQGEFMATVLVKDDNGATGTYSVPITVTGDQAYDEMEDNDKRSEAMELSWFPESDTPSFLGDIGLGGGYNGDAADVFSFQLTQPGNLQWILNTLDTEHGVLEIELKYVDGNIVTSIASDESGNQVLAIGENLAETAGTYYLYVRPMSGSSRYDFSLHFTP